MSIRIVDASDPEFSHEYERCRPWLVKALDRPESTAGEMTLIRRLLSGDALLWTTDDYALVTEMRHEEKERSLHIWVAGGEGTGKLILDHFLDASAVLSDYAEEEGFDAITIDGRMGWMRILKSNEEYEPVTVLMKKRIHGRRR